MATSSSNVITLKGSTDIVAEFFHRDVEVNHHTWWYARTRAQTSEDFTPFLSHPSYNLVDYGLNSILYQRGLYPPESFTHTQQWGLTMLVTCNKELQKFLEQIISQVKAWLTDMTVEKLVLVIKEIATNEVLERWQFDVDCDKSVDSNTKREVSDKEIKEGIRSVIRQITASVTFLPLLDSACSFDILVYTDKGLEVPEAWGETGPHFITNSEEVRLKSFSTSIHTVKAAVAFKKSD